MLPTVRILIERQHVAWQLLHLLHDLEYLHHVTELSKEFIIYVGPHGNVGLRIYIYIIFLKMSIYNIVPKVQVCLCYFGLFDCEMQERGTNLQTQKSGG